MNNANQQHYFKSAWNNEYHCAQCGEPITAERHIRAPRIGLEEWIKGMLKPSQGSNAK